MYMYIICMEYLEHVYHSTMMFQKSYTIHSLKYLFCPKKKSASRTQQDRHREPLGAEIYAYPVVCVIQLEADFNLIFIIKNNET